MKKQPTADLSDKIIRHRAVLLAALRDVNRILVLEMPDFRAHALEVIERAQKATKL